MSTTIELEFEMVHGEDAIRIVTARNIPCGECGAMHWLFVNRCGRTRCIGCDRKLRGAEEGI